MGFEIDVRPERREADVRCDASTGLACCCRVIQDLASHPDFRPEFTILADLREIAWVPEIDEARAVADKMRDHRDAYRDRIALVVRPGVRYGVARMVATLAKLRGLDVEAFTDVGAARRRLGRLPTAVHSGAWSADAGVRPNFG